jgi:chromosome condensin MukBEF ATPase and DNA-binding subunit MukB
MADDRDEGPISYVKAAFHWQYNWISLAGAAGFALVSGSALPLLLGAGLELIYLSTVPQIPRFQRLVRSWKYAEQKKRQEKGLTELFHELPPEMRARYARVDAICRGIRENYRRLTATSQMFAEQMESKLDGLLQSDVRLLNSAFHHRQYLATTNPETIRKEAAALQAALEKEPAKVQEINRKRIEILNKRMEKFGTIKENCQVVEAQCSAIEDVLQLIRDQSVTMHDPQQISDHLDNLVKDVEQTEVTVREVESIFDLSPLATPDFTGDMPTGGKTFGGRVSN